MNVSLSSPPGYRDGDDLPGKGYGRCYGCHRPWYAADKPVGVSFKDKWRQFALCQECWDSSTTEERVEAHLWVCTQWVQMQLHDGDFTQGLPISTTTERITRAVEGDDVDMWSAL